MYASRLQSESKHSEVSNLIQQEQAGCKPDWKEKNRARKKRYKKSIEHVRKLPVKCAGTFVSLYPILLGGCDVVRVRIGWSSENHTSRIFTDYPQLVKFISNGCLPAASSHCRGLTRSHDDGELPYAEHLDIDDIWGPNGSIARALAHDPLHRRSFRCRSRSTCVAREIVMECCRNHENA